MTVSDRIAVLRMELETLAGEVERERDERMRGLRLAARALRQAESTAQWVQMLADAAAALAGRCAFLRVEVETLICSAARGVAFGGEFTIPGSQAPALWQAVESRETVVTLRVPSQLSPELAAQMSGDANPLTAGKPTRGHIFPLVGKTRVLAVLYAEDADVHGMEVLMAIAAATLELREAKAVSSFTPVITAAPSLPAPGAAVAINRGNEIDPEYQARRFARKEVAEWLLQETASVARGREMRDIYGALRKRIDDARVEYSRQFAEVVKPDYLHLEIVERLARNDDSMLGPSYPGPLR